MKKRLLKALIIITMLFGIILPINVKADTNEKIMSGGWIPNIYIAKIDEDGGKHYQQARLLKRVSDSKQVYCVEPGVSIDFNANYIGKNIDNNSLEKAMLLAYYGYNYVDDKVNHSDIKWVAIAQVEIWKSVLNIWNFYYTDTLRGNKINDKFASEIAELHSLVDSHYITPSFSKTNNKISIDSTLTLTDSNNVINKYAIEQNELVSTSIVNDKLIITPKGVGKTTLVLHKKSSNYNEKPFLYTANDSQTVMSVGDLEDVEATINIEITGGSILINKLDYDTNNPKAQGEASLKGAIYGVYDLDDNKVGSITTDENGKGKSDFLPSLGRFYVKEEKASNGYLLDNTKCYFEITLANPFPEINVYEKVIRRELEINKVYDNGTSEIMKPEANAMFAFYNKNNELEIEGVTDKDGRLVVNLVFGTYLVKQLSTGNLNYEKVKDFYITVDNSGEIIRLTISNAIKTAKLKVIKIDEDTKENILIPGIKFKIFNLDTNKYVEQTITYPSREIINIFETDENGIIITPYPIAYGNYRLEEINQIIEGYLWNEEPLEFTINVDSKFIEDENYGDLFEIKFSNKEVKGKLIINKLGEKLIIENNSYRYEQINLDNVKFNLYAAENIYSSNKKIIYEKDELIATLTTNKAGYAELDNLPLGSYYLLEVSSSNNNAINNTKHYFTLDYIDQYTSTAEKKIILNNYYNKGKLEFIKTDLITGVAIPNTIIEVYTIDDKLIFTGKTDENGKITIYDLFVSRFYIIEKEAALGYQLTEEKVFFEIKENEGIVKISMNNELIPTITPDSNLTSIVVPNTENNDYYYFKSMILLFAGMGIIIYEKKKQFIKNWINAYFFRNKSI